MAVQLVIKLRETLQIDMSAYNLINFPNINALAKFITETTRECQNVPIHSGLSDLLVEIQLGDPQKRPLFLMPSVGGEVYFHRNLVHYLDSKQPVYGIQAQGLDGKTKPFTQIEAMATHYIEVIRTYQPKGPYFLGGYCLGGMIAFEIAKQLHALDQPVALLAMIDTRSPEQISAQMDIQMLIQIFGGNPENLSASFLNQLKQLELEEQLQCVLNEQKRSNQSILPIDLDTKQILYLFRFYQVNLQAMHNYQPREYPGKIIFFRAQEKATDIQNDITSTWINLAQEGMEIIDIPGSHATMYDFPHVQVLAKRLSSYLE